MNFLLISQKEKQSEPDIGVLNKVMGSVQTHKIDNETSFYCAEKNETECFASGRDVVGYVVGYVRDTFDVSLPSVRDHNTTVLEEIDSKKWPLADRFTGAFGTCSLNKATSIVTLANDPVGIYPIYYYISPEMVVVSSSLILMAHATNQSLDNVGAAERMTPGDYANFGRRTLLENVKRLLPGEAVYLDARDMSLIDNLFDNTLYQNITKKTSGERAQTTWQLIKKEVSIALASYTDIGIAMSGGLDSRVVLGAVDRGKRIRCCSYGEPNFYETRMAEKCAKHHGAEFESHSMYENHFTDRSVLMKYVMTTEAVGNLSWNNLLESNKSLSEESVFTLGDTCDLLTAKNIKKHRSRKAKIKDFWRYLLWGKDIPLAEMTDSLFEEWKSQKLDEILGSLSKSLTGFESQRMEIEKGIRSDLGELFERIDAHRLPYVELLDELFGIYIHGRAMSKQLLMCKARFLALAPIMSIGIARTATSIHPSEKIHFKLFDRIFRHKDLHHLAEVPTAQVPFIPYACPGNVKLVVWGLRSILDNILIKMQMHLKSPYFRHRLLRSINWCRVYRQSGAVENVKSWFVTDHIGQKENCLKIMNDRAEQESWPLTSYDIGCLSALNLEIEAIESTRI